MDKEQQFTIELLGDGRIEIATGQTILAASLAAGIAHYHACGGKGQCSTCWVLVHEGAAHLFAESEKESNLRRRIHFPASVRLACQTYVVGENVKVHRMIRDETDVGFLYKWKRTGQHGLHRRGKGACLIFSGHPQLYAVCGNVPALRRDSYSAPLICPFSGSG